MHPCIVLFHFLYMARERFKRNKKVLRINYSQRKKITCKLIEMVMEGITNLEKEKIITLSIYKNFNFCLRCCNCMYVPPESAYKRMVYRIYKRTRYVQ